MAIGTGASLTLYDEEFHGGFVETVQQNVSVFNEVSRGALLLETDFHIGNYDKETFFDVVASLISRRDTTSVSAATDLSMTTDEFVGVKLNRTIGPVAQTLDAWKKIGRDQRVMSFVLGQQIAKAVMQEQLNRALAALEAKLDSVAALEEDDTAAVITVAGLVDLLSKQGDAAGNLACLVMHSKVYFDLIKAQVADAVYRANGVAVMQGTPATFGRPVIVTDSSSLVESDGVSTGVDAYSTLALFPGAARVAISEPSTIVMDLVTGLDNLVYRMQGEYAYTLSLRGCEWDVTNGGANPTDANVATATNWDTQVADNKLLPGAILKTR